jgi:polysaccharide chain length determinant protein (PEP-CTERM system associated)
MPISPKFDYKEFLSAVKLRGKYISIVILICVLVGGILFVVTPKKYQSTTTILIIPQRVPESYVHTTVSLRIEDRLASMRQQIMSRTRLLSLMQELKLFDRKNDKRSDDELIEQVRKQIELQIRGSDSFVLSFTHENKQLAMLTTSKMASFFIDENLRIREQQAVGTSDFLESQLQEMKSKLETQENIVKQYRTRYMGQLPQQLEANIAALNRWQDQFRSVSDAIRSTEDRKIFYESQLTSLQQPQKPGPRTVLATTDRPGERSVETSLTSTGDQDLIREFRNKQARLAELSAKYTENYPEIISLKKDLNRLEKSIIAAGSSQANGTESRPRAPGPPANMVEQFRDPTYGIELQRYQQDFQRYEQEEKRLSNEIKSSQLELVSLRKKVKDIEQNIAGFQGKIDSAPKREQELYSINRDYENLKTSYNDMLRKKLDAQVSTNLEKQQKGAQFQIVDPPNLPDSPISPKKQIYIAVTMLLSLIFGLGGALVMEYFDKTIREKEYFVKYFDLPVFASIPMLPDPKEIRIKRIINSVIVIFSIILILGIMATIYYGIAIKA